jgi:hypothetical protein
VPHRHPNAGDLYTPMTPEVYALFERMLHEHGTWRQVAALTETRLKVLRNLRKGKRKAISQRLLDRLCTGTKVGAVHEFPWFTADDLVTLGIWDPVQYVEGRKRIKGESVIIVEESELRERRKKARIRSKESAKRRKRNLRLK